MSDDHRSAAPKASWRHLSGQLARDPPLRITLAAVAALATFSFLPVAEPLRVAALYGATPVLLTWNIIWLATRSREATGEARQFWQDLTCAAVAWWLGSVLLLLPADIPAAPALLTNAVFAAMYVFLLRATDRTLREPTEPNAGRWVLATIFVAGLFVYWVLLGEIGAPIRSRSELSSRLLFISADSYLTVRFGYLAWRARGPWRTIFVILGASLAAMLVYAVARMTDAPARYTQALWYLPFLLWLIAGRIPTGARGIDRQVALPGTRGTALAGVLVLPMIHFAGYGSFRILDPSLRDWRDLLVCAWLLVFGGFAIAQRRRLHRQLRGLIDERRVLLRSTDASTDLRVILEKRRTDETVGQSAEKYMRAFDLCPEAIGISTLANGRFLEVNPAFEGLTGYSREEILGRSSAELRIWLHSHDRDRIVERVREQGTVRGLTLPFRANGGQRKIASFTAQPLDIDGEPCVIIVARELDQTQALATLHALPAPFAAAPFPAFLVERDGEIGAWNQAAEPTDDGPSVARDGIVSLAFDDDVQAWSRFRRQLLRDGFARKINAIALVVDDGDAQALLVLSQLPR